MRIQGKKFYTGGEEFNTFKAAMREILWKRMMELGVGIETEIKVKNITEYVSIKMFFEMNGRVILEEGFPQFPCVLKFNNISKYVVGFEIK